MNGAQAIAAALADVAPTVFGLLGDGNLALVDELVAVHGTRFVATRHEHAAVCAAMAWAEATGGTGVATTTHGPGLAQTASALLTAARARSRVLLVVGSTHPAARLHAQALDQATFARACGATHVRVRSSATIAEDLAIALRAMRDGPVVLDADLAVQAAAVPAGAGGRLPPPAPVPPTPAAPDPAAVAAAAGVLGGAATPLVLVGRGAAHALDGVAALADDLGAWIGTTLLAHGLLADHPRQLGVVGGFSTAAARRRLADVDAVLAVGASLSRFTVDGGRLFGGVPIIQVDADARAVGDPVPVEVAVLADAGEAVGALRAAVARVRAGRGAGSPRQVGGAGAGASGGGGVGGDVDGPDDDDRVRDDPDGDDPRDVLDAVDATLPAARGLVVGVGGYSGWGALHVRVPDPSARLLPWSFGAVGIALGAAVGLAVARPDQPTLCVEGDGGAMMTLPELDTLAREGLPVLVLVLDDRGFGAEAEILRREGRPPDRAWIPTPDLVAAARGLGLRATSARGADVGPAVRDLLPALPALLHVPTSRRAVHHEIFAALAP